MAKSFLVGVRKEGKEVTNVQLISNDVRQPSFQAILKIAYKGDLFGVLSMIPLKVFMIQDLRCFYTCKIGEVEDMEIRDVYSQLCDNGVLREENKIAEKKGLTRALNFLKKIKI